jgi:hypothetical protein
MMAEGTAAIKMQRLKQEQLLQAAAICCNWLQLAAKPRLKAKG